MTPLIVAAALSILALDAGQATTQSTTGGAGTQVAVKSPPTTDADEQNKVICHNEEVTGSRFKKRICLTRAEWGEQQRRTEELTRRLGESAGLNAAGATGGGMTNGGQ